MTDQLQGSPVLAEVLGDALPKLERFHAKIAEEGEPRGSAPVTSISFGNGIF